MFVVTNRLNVAPENAAEFERVFSASMRDTLGGVPGLIRSTLQRPVADSLPYISTMEFTSREDFGAWLKSDSFRASHSNVEANSLTTSSVVEQHTIIEDLSA
mgnify:CR=1 FL=1